MAFSLLVIVITMELRPVEGLPGPRLRRLLRRTRALDARTTLPVDIHRMALRLGMVLHHLLLLSKQESAVVLACLLGGRDLRLAPKDAS